MTDQTPPPPPDPSIPAPPPPPPAYDPGAVAPPPPANPYGGPPVNPYGAPVPMGPGPVGKVRSTGTCILLFIVTLGIYSYFWYYNVHEEMKRHTGRGIGGVLAFVLAFFIGVASPFLASSEVGQMQELAGRQKTVSGTTGLWYLPGILLLGIGPIVWFVKTNGALNDYWKSMGAQG